MVHCSLTIIAMTSLARPWALHNPLSYNLQYTTGMGSHNHDVTGVEINSHHQQIAQHNCISLQRLQLQHVI